MPIAGIVPAKSRGPYYSSSTSIGTIPNSAGTRHTAGMAGWHVPALQRDRPPPSYLVANFQQKQSSGVCLQAAMILYSESKWFVSQNMGAVSEGLTPIMSSPRGLLRESPLLIVIIGENVLLWDPPRVTNRGQHSGRWASDDGVVATERATHLTSPTLPHSAAAEG